MKREGWGSRLGFILAAAGSAVGLGNIWRFPILTAKHGGFAFLLIYLILVFTISYCIMLGKLALGRVSRTNSVDAFENNAPSHKAFWGFFGGWVGIVSALLIMFFYFIIAGWTLFYGWESITGAIMEVQDPQAHFSEIQSNFWLQFFFGFMFILFTAGVVVAGVKSGIEKLSSWLMPVLFVILFVIVIRAITMEGSSDGIALLLTPDWTKLGFTGSGFDFSMFGNVLVDALGQAFFSLSLGMGTMIVYGSYASDRDNLLSTTAQIISLDTFVALMASFAVVPALFAGGLVTVDNISSFAGPGLTFISLPKIFQTMYMGQFFSFLFYFLLMIAALTSTISMYEPVAALLMDRFKLARRKAVGLIMTINIIGFTLVALSSSGALDIRVFGRDLLDFFDMFSSTFTFTIASLAASVFIGWVVKDKVISNIRMSSNVGEGFISYFTFVLRYVSPIAIVIVILFKLI